MSPESIGVLMLATLIVTIFIGFPISFTLLVLAVAFGYLGMGSIVFDLMVFQTIGLMKEETLAAVPLFIFMGYVIEQSGLMERLFRAFQYLLAPVRGSLYVGVILTATIFAMATGIVGAAVTVLGIMAGPIMMKARYDVRLSAGAIAAGGTLGILVPPSVMLVVMGPVIGVSVVQLYAAAFGPGFLLAFLYILYTLIRSYLNPALGPALPMEERAPSFGHIVREFLFGMVPLGSLIFATLGTILGGLATPTEAAAMGASGAIVLTLCYRELTWGRFRDAVFKTLTTSSMVLFLAVTSNVFGSVFSRLGTATLMTNTLLGLPFPPTVMMVILMALIFLLGWPFEWPAIVLVFVPIFLPLVQALKFDLILFGILVAVNLQTAFLSPPVAMSAYYLKSVAPMWDLRDIYGGMMQFMVLQVIALLLVIMFPQIALWLPTVLFK
ncbi:MAG: TRAP transporter large permease subunit [Candidatus Rokubacteria bacterium]|nr:TRAP transporter large permease subunit [Candidatus Rokubacteria bacterium]